MHIDSERVMWYGFEKRRSHDTSPRRLSPYPLPPLTGPTFFAYLHAFSILEQGQVRGLTDLSSLNERLSQMWNDSPPAMKTKCTKLAAADAKRFKCESEIKCVVFSQCFITKHVVTPLSLVAFTYSLSLFLSLSLPQIR